MDKALLDRTLQAFLGEAQTRLDEIVQIISAAEDHSENGQTEDAVHLALGIDGLLYEVRTLVNASSLINRLWSA
ncbi:hypothetical protein [Bauldia litoralis]|uniref:hypothetical protein n=1 Tax=Bauldia litoralis TaxID=665467 RepID=UPI0032639A7F